MIQISDAWIHTQERKISIDVRVNSVYTYLKWFSDLSSKNIKSLPKKIKHWYVLKASNNHLYTFNKQILHVQSCLCQYSTMAAASVKQQQCHNRGAGCILYLYWHVPLNYSQMNSSSSITLLMIQPTLTLTLPGPSAGVNGSLDSYCSLKPLCSGMGEVVPARTSPTLLPPSPRTVLSLSCFKVSQCINCCDWHCKS